MKTKTKVCDANKRVPFSALGLMQQFVLANKCPEYLTEVVDRILQSAAVGEASDRLEALLLFSPLHIEEFKYVRQLWGFVRKVRPRALADREALEAHALRKFLEAEDRCRAANARIGFSRTESGVDADTRLVLGRARSYLYKWLPTICERVYTEIIHGARSGPGLSIGSANRYRTSECWKLSTDTLATTSSAWSMLHDFISSSEVLKKRWIEERRPTCIASLNNVVFVPKTSTSLRTIAIEPSGNMLLQLGVHDYLAKILYRIGNGIGPGAQERQQMLAWSGSLTDELATVDLSAASDSISIALLYQLVPHDWYRLLMALRVERGLLPDGTIIKYEKVSSMGNGYTFALQTLIFLALSCAVCENREPRTYGDDIVIPSSSYERLERVFHDLGLVINKTKSFHRGPFRESCGKDWYNGIDVTPAYNRSDDCNLGERYAFLNHLASKGWATGRVANMLLSGYTVSHGLPHNPIDSCLHTTSVPYLKGTGQWKWNRSTQSYLQRIISPIVVYDSISSSIDSLIPILQLRYSATVSKIPLRGAVTYRYIWVPAEARGGDLPLRS